MDPRPAPTRPDALLFEALPDDDARKAREALALGASPNARDPEREDGDSAFLASLRWGAFECAELLWPGANPLGFGAYRQNAVMVAATTKNKAWLQRALLSGDPLHRDEMGRDALRIAADVGSLEAIELLLPVSDPDGVDHHGRSALRSAIERGSEDCADLLIRASKNLELHRALDGVTLLDAAASFGRPRSFALMESRCPTPLQRDDFGRFLRLAAARGHAEFVGWMLPRADPLAVDEWDRTPLMLAIDAGSFSCCALLAPVSDFEARDAKGRNAMERARAISRPESSHLATWLEAERELLALQREASPGAPGGPRPRI